MRRNATLCGWCSWLVLVNAGCQTAGLNFLSLIGLQKKPVSVAVVVDRPLEAAEALNPFSAYGSLQKAMSSELGRPVAIDVCFPFQVEGGLSSGWHDLAILTPTQYARLTSPGQLRTAAFAVDRDGQAVRPAVLIVRADSPIQQIADLRGRVVAFGPAEDARTHYAALQLLEANGLKPSDLALELLPLPGSLKHLPDGRAVAQSVLNQSSDAGFIDEAAWEALPEEPARAGEPARGRLRVISRTAALPTRILVAGPKLDQATFESVRAFLLAAGQKHPQALEPLRLKGYQTTDEATLTACRELKRVAAAAPPASEPDTPAPTMPPQ